MSRPKALNHRRAPSPRGPRTPRRLPLSKRPRKRMSRSMGCKRSEGPEMLGVWATHPCWSLGSHERLGRMARWPRSGRAGGRNAMRRFLMLALLMLSSLALAQDKGGGGKKAQVIDFED